ncbi:MAG: FAD-binding oxidoreductase [Clostridia bacterium]|nr:FAD-binding oxidoreductase [Clostridia bacterium]
MATNYNIKTDRTFTIIRKYGFIFTLSVAIIGLWQPLIGLLVIPVMIGLTLYSFFKGRYWCGNICAHGSLYDSVLIKFSRNTKIPKFFRSKTLTILFFTFFMLMLTRRFIKVIGLYGSAMFFERLGFIFVMSYIMVTIVGGTLGLLFAPRTWCNFCPMGTVQKLSYSLGKKLGVTKTTDEKVTVSHKSMCHQCGKCARVCPMQLAPFKEFSDHNQFDHEACIRCLTCVENCPAEILTLNNQKTAQLIKNNINTSGFESRTRIKAQIEEIKELTNDIRAYTLKFIEPQKVSYSPGQFMLVKILNDPETFRAYTISSTNDDETKVRVTVKSVENGYGTSIIFNQFKTGDIIDLEGPMGRELVIEPSAEKVLLIGVGIGVTPFLPIVHDILNNNNTIKEIKLLFGTKYEKEQVYKEALENLEKESKGRFEFRRIVSRENDWKGRKGHVTDHLSDINLAGYKVYMCGPKKAMESSLEKLIELGVPPEDIRYESA